MSQKSGTVTGIGRCSRGPSEEKTGGGVYLFCIRQYGKRPLSAARPEARRDGTRFWPPDAQVRGMHPGLLTHATHKNNLILSLERNRRGKGQAVKYRYDMGGYRKGQGPIGGQISGKKRPAQSRPET